jgi:hypothetical protein
MGKGVTYMEYIAPQLTLVGSVSGVVLGGFALGPEQPGSHDQQASLEAEW